MRIQMRYFIRRYVAGGDAKDGIVSLAEQHLYV